MNVLFTIKPAYGIKGTSNWFQCVCHCIAWPYGVILVTFSDGIFFYPIKYKQVYLFGSGCQGDFQFEERNNECLLAGNGRWFFILFYTTVLILFLLSIIAYLKTFFVARKVWKDNNAKVLRNLYQDYVNDDLMDGTFIAADHSYTVFKTTIRLSSTALLYIISIFPIIVVQFYALNNGPIHGKYRALYDIWFDLLGNVIGVVNVIFYGYFSPIFRHEMIRLKNRFKSFLIRKYYKLTGKANSVMTSDHDLEVECEDEFDVSFSSSGIGRDSSLEWSREYILR